MKKAALTLWLATATLAPVAGAQTQAPKPPVPAQAPAPVPGAAAPPASAGASGRDADPTLPNVEDPMLAPSPPPQHVLQSWREALGLVRSRSVPYRTALAQIDVARAKSREALAASLPTLQSTAFNTYARYEILRGTGINYNVVPPAVVSLPDPPVTLGAGLTLNVPLFAPKAWYDRGTAERAIDYAALNSKEAERQVVASLADTIVAAVTAERLADVTRVSLQSALSTLDLNRRRSALGASSSLDVLRAEGEVQTARAQVVTANETLLRARESLGLALGYSEGWAVNPEVHLDALGADARATCRQEADVSKRSDVRAAAANVGLVERAKGSVDWAFWPTLTANSVLQTQNVKFGTQNNVSWTVSGVLTWMLYDGGLRYGQKDEAEANARVAREQLSDTRRRAELQVTQAFRSVTVAETNLAVSTKGREIAAETARLARVAFINGSGTSFDLVDTASKQRQAEIDLTVKQFELLRAKVAALLALASCDI
ncbi:MAG TPA: TolC family protein [Polyangiaceae bacterium]|nr:TolC family protein [Polyangiaceae bacterium]